MLGAIIGDIVSSAYINNNLTIDYKITPQKLPQMERCGGELIGVGYNYTKMLYREESSFFMSS